VLPIRTRTRIVDIATGEELPRQIVFKKGRRSMVGAEVKDIPAMGYKALKIELPGFNARDDEEGNSEVLENDFL